MRKMRKGQVGVIVWMAMNGMLSIWPLPCSIWHCWGIFVGDIVYNPQIHFSLSYWVAVNISGEMTISPRSGYQWAVGHPICLTLLIQGWKHPGKFDSVKERFISGFSMQRQINTLDESEILGCWLLMQPSKTIRGRIQAKKVELIKLQWSRWAQISNCHCTFSAMGQWNSSLSDSIWITLLFLGTQNILPKKCLGKKR